MRPSRSLGLLLPLAFMVWSGALRADPLAYLRALMRYCTGRSAKIDSSQRVPPTGARPPGPPPIPPADRRPPTNGAEFLAAFEKNPQDNELARNYAEWLDRNKKGDPRAKLIRLALAIRERRGSREAAIRRMDGIKKRHEAEWLDGFPNAKQVRYEKGILFSAEVDLKELADWARRKPLPATTIPRLRVIIPARMMGGNALHGEGDLAAFRALYGNPEALKRLGMKSITDVIREHWGQPPEGQTRDEMRERAKTATGVNLGEQVTAEVLRNLVVRPQKLEDLARNFYSQERFMFEATLGISPLVGIGKQLSPAEIARFIRENSHPDYSGYDEDHVREFLGNLLHSELYPVRGSDTVFLRP